MSSVRDDAIYILRHILEEGYGSESTVADLKCKTALPVERYDAADAFLLESYLLNGTMGGDAGSRWLKPLAVEWLENEMTSHMRLSLVAEQIMRVLVAVEREPIGANADLIPGWVQTRLKLTEDQFKVAVQSLVDRGLASADWDGYATKIAALTSTPQGRVAVQNGFRVEDRLVPTSVNIGSVVGTMHGGNVQGIGQVNQSEIDQIVNDPEALTGVLDRVFAELIDAVKGELPGQQLIAYIQKAAELKAELKAERPNPAAAKGLLSTLAFLGDIEGTVGLAGRVWSLIGPLVPLVLTVLQNTTR